MTGLVSLLRRRGAESRTCVRPIRSAAFLRRYLNEGTLDEVRIVVDELKRIGEDFLPSISDSRA